MVVFDSAAVYIECAKTIREKITRIDAVIAALENSALKSAEKGNVTEYTLDDGQTKIHQVYRSPLEVQKSIEAFEAIRQRYINRLNGRVMRLVDGQNFTRNRYGKRN